MTNAASTTISLPVTIEIEAATLGSARWVAENLQQNNVQMVLKGGTVYLLYPDHRTSKGVLNPLWKRIAWVADGKIQVPSGQATEFTRRELLSIPLNISNLGQLQPGGLEIYLELEQEAVKLLETKMEKDDHYLVSVNLK